MRTTAEIRWFWQGAPPPRFKAWFVAAGPSWPAARESETRIDAYLRDTEQRELGIKERGGSMVEVKGLISRQPFTQSFAGCSAPVELWAKWSSGALTLSAVEKIAVEKKRWLRQCAVQAGAASELQSDYGNRTNGCDVELTLLGMPDGAAWWTLGFEAFGGFERVISDLTVTVALMASRQPLSLPGGLAAGYPAWLAGLASGKG